MPFGDGENREDTVTNFVSMMREYASENYWHDSWDIMARMPDDEITAAIHGASTRRGAIAKAWGYIQILDRLRRAGNGEVIFRYGRQPKKPVSLFEFMAARGGLQPHPDLKYILDGNPRIGRLGSLIRETGLSLDRAREASVEAGYLFDPAAIAGTVTESTINDLLAAITEEAGGNKRYPHGEELMPEGSNFEAQEQSNEVPF